MNDVEIQEVALEAISEVPYVGYQQIDKMIVNIGSLTMALMQTDRFGAIRRAFSFWSNLAEEERRQASFNQSANIINSCLESLLQIILSGL